MKQKKRNYSFIRLFCKRVTFLDFEKAACENAVIYVKRRQFAFQLRQQIKDEQIKWEDLAKTWLYK